MGKQFKLIKPLGAGLGLKDIFIKDTVNDWYYYKTDQVVDKLNEQQRTINEKNIEIEELKIHIEKLVDGSEISQLLMKEYEKNEQLINRCKEQKSIITKQDKIIKEAGKTLTDPKNYQSVISIKDAIQYAIKILKEGADEN